MKLFNLLSSVLFRCWKITLIRQLIAPTIRIISKELAILASIPNLKPNNAQTVPVNRQPKKTVFIRRSTFLTLSRNSFREVVSCCRNIFSEICTMLSTAFRSPATFALAVRALKLWSKPRVRWSSFFGTMYPHGGDGSRCFTILLLNIRYI